MPRPSRERPEGKILAQRMMIAEGWAQGQPQHEMATLLGRSRQLVNKEVRKLREEWKARAAKTVNALIEEMLARIEWAQWECVQVWAEARQAVRGNAERRASELFALAQDALLDRLLTDGAEPFAPIAWADLGADVRGAIALAVGDAADLPMEAMRENGRQEARKMDLLGLRGQYQPEHDAEDLPDPESIKTAEDAEHAYRRAVGRYKPFQIVQGGRSRGRS